MDPPLCAVAPSVICASGCLALLVAFRPPSRSAASDIVRTPSIPLTSRALVRSAAPSDACNSDVAPVGPLSAAERPCTSTLRYKTLEDCVHDHYCPGTHIEIQPPRPLHRTPVPLSTLTPRF